MGSIEGKQGAAKVFAFYSPLGYGGARNLQCQARNNLVKLAASPRHIPS